MGVMHLVSILIALGFTLLYKWFVSNKTPLLGTKFGFLFGLSEDGHDSGLELSEQEARMKDLFMELRKEILDIGNQQMKNVESEIEQYDVKWNRYQITLPVKKQGE